MSSLLTFASLEKEYRRMKAEAETVQKRFDGLPTDQQIAVMYAMECYRESQRIPIQYRDPRYILSWDMGKPQD